MVAIWPCFARWYFLVLKLSTKINIPRRGRIRLYSPQFLPLLGQEGQEYLSLLGFNTRYRNPCQAELLSPSLSSNPWGVGCPSGFRAAAQQEGRAELIPPCQAVSCVDTLLVGYSYPSLLDVHCRAGLLVLIPLSTKYLTYVRVFTHRSELQGLVLY